MITRPARHEALVTPRRAVVYLRGDRFRALLDDKKSKHREVCKCSYSRSEAQKEVSRKFFSSYGSRGAGAGAGARVCACR